MKPRHLFALAALLLTSLRAQAQDIRYTDENLYIEEVILVEGESAEVLLDRATGWIKGTLQSDVTSQPTTVKGGGAACQFESKVLDQLMVDRIYYQVELSCDAGNCKVWIGEVSYTEEQEAYQGEFAPRPLKPTALFVPLGKGQKKNGDYKTRPGLFKTETEACLLDAYQSLKSAIEGK